MPKFGVYYIPKAESEFYRLGSSIIGFDIHSQNELTLPKNIEKDWVTKAKPYGFHLTIGDAIDCNIKDIASVKAELSKIIACFDPNKHKFELTKRSGKPLVDVLSKQVFVLRYNANKNLLMFQTLVAALINPMGQGSVYTDEYKQNSTQDDPLPYKGHRIKKFYSPYVLNHYKPHFTLLNPYTGNTPEKIKKYLNNTFKKFKEIEIESICLVTQNAEGQNYEIREKFPC